MKVKNIKQCLFCGGDFEYRIQRKHYCCPEHYKEHQRQKARDNNSWKYQERNCLNSVCNIRFKPKYKDQIYHSHSCAATVINAVRKPPSAETKQKLKNTLLANAKEQKRLRKIADVFRVSVRTLMLKNAVLAWNQCSICYMLWSNGFIKSKKRTCSSECLHILRSRAGRKAASVRIKRSKDEIALFEMCHNYYQNVTHNEILFDGWDADIIIYDTKTAILWNGPWHYRQMEHNNHSLLQVKTRDKIKRDLFEANGWVVIAYEDRHYTPEAAFQDLLRR